MTCGQERAVLELAGQVHAAAYSEYLIAKATLDAAQAQLELAVASHRDCMLAAEGVEPPVEPVGGMTYDDIQLRRQPST